MKGSFLKSSELSYKMEDVWRAGGFGISYKVSTDVIKGNSPIYSFFAEKDHSLSDCCEIKDGAICIFIGKTT